VLEVIGALFALLGAAAFGLVSTYMSAVGISGLISAISGFGSMLLVIIGIILILGAYGLWIGHRWGYWLGVVIACLGVISIAILDAFGFIVGIVVLYYLTRKRVKKWFRIN
jgi:hypothetical protein